MIQISGDIWDYHNKKEWIGVTTNGVINYKGQAVMGKGIAREASDRFPFLSELVGMHISNYGNHVNFMTGFKIVTIPTKNHWRHKSDIYLIQRSCHELVKGLDRTGVTRLYIPRLGCGNGGLSWKLEVEEILNKILDDRIYIVHKENE